MCARLTKIVLEVVALAAIAFTSLSVAWSWNSLPETIPTHFNLYGQPDGFGPRWFLILIPVLGAALYLLHTAIERYPRLAYKPYRSEAENIRHAAIARRLMPWMKAELGLLFAYIQWTIIATAQGIVLGLNPFVMTGLIVAILATVIGHVIGLKRRGK